VDGHSHHNHQKRDLQVLVSRKGCLTRARGKKASKDGSKRVLTKEMILLKCSYVYMFISCMLSATDDDYV
jgi:hypothetical protein